MDHPNPLQTLTARLAHDRRLAARLAHFYEQLRALPRAGRRRLMRRVGMSLAAAALLLALSRAPAIVPAWADAAATITVVNGEEAAADNGKCSLIEAINNANDTADGVGDGPGDDDCAVGNPAGADVIALPAGGSFSVNKVVDDYYGYSALPLINSAVTVAGNGATITRGGNKDMRFFTVVEGGDLTLDDLSLTNGKNYYQVGGAIYAYHGRLTVNHCTISGNEAALGGGIAAYNSDVVITDTVLDDNPTYYGGALYAGRGTLVMSDSTITDNKADMGGGGGGLYLTGLTADLRRLVVTGNTAGFGGGVLIAGSQVTLRESTIAGNEAKVSGGGLFVRPGSAVTVVNSTISGNEAAGAGGGVFVGAAVTLSNTTVSGNSAVNSGGGVIVFDGALTLNRTLVAGNTAPTGREVNRQLGTATVGNHNLFGFGGNAGLNGFSAGPTDVVPAGALAAVLGPLGDNGGPTETHALPLGSAAIDGAPSAACAAGPVGGIDQRGQPRNVEGNGAASTAECDIGAFEFAPDGPLPSPTPTVTGTIPATATPSPTPDQTATATPTGTILATATATTTPTATGTPFVPSNFVYVPVVVGE